MSRSKNEPKTIRFKAGDMVRVKYGVIDPDFPDIPLGGWTGAITEIEAAAGQVTYEIRWDKKTLEGIHPVYRNRCERDGLEVETMWLGDEDLEPDDGSRVPIEQPTKIVTKPLSEKDQDDRVRMALALTHDDPLPQVGRKTLLVYYRYLAVNLKFPFRAKSQSDNQSLTVHRLLDPKEYELDEEEGLLCEVGSRETRFEIPLAELDDAVGNRNLVQDYGYWFWNWN